MTHLTHGGFGSQLSEQGVRGSTQTDTRFEDAVRDRMFRLKKRKEKINVYCSDDDHDRVHI